MSVLFEPGRLKLTLDDVRAAVKTNVRQLAADRAHEQLDALFRLVNMTVGPKGVWTVEGAARLLKATRRNHLRLIRGGREK